jgi:ribonuclease BN (tRNA processing enzyme)
VELTVVGAGPAYTSRAGAASSGYLLRVDGASLLLDLGQGSFANLAATVEPSSLAGVLITHLHPDHFIDLVALRHYLRWEFEPPRRVAVAGPAGLGDRLDGLMSEPGFAAVTLDVGPLAAGTWRVGPFLVETRRVEHTEESYAFRVSNGTAPANGGVAAAGGAPRGLVYSGDCGRPEDLAPLVRPGDVLLAEASFGPGPVPDGASHMTAADAARLAAAGGASRLLLTHILAGHSRAETLAAAQAEFAGPVQLVTEGDRFEI